MRFTVSLFAHHLGLIAPDLRGLEVQGAHLGSRRMIEAFARDPRVARLEIFVQSVDYLDHGALQSAAKHLLPPERLGKGFMRVFPIQNLPEVFADGEERIWWGQDFDWLARDRYLRDRFASGPTPIVCDTHTLGWLSNGDTLLRLAQGPAVPYDVLACISRAYAEAVERSWSLLLGRLGERPRSMPFRLADVPRAVDTDRFFPATPDQKLAARRAFGIPSDRRVVLSFSRVTPYDKADLRPLLRAFSQVRRETDVLVVAGREGVPGAYEMLRVEAERLGIEPMFLGAVAPDQAPDLLRAADVFVFLSDTTQEALGTAQVEALATGLPTVVSDWDGSRDVVIDGETGLRTPTYWIPGLDRVSEMSPAGRHLTTGLIQAQSVWIDPDALASRLRYLLDNPDEGRRLGQAGREHVVRRYSLAAVMDQLFATFAESLDLARAEPRDDAAQRRARAEAIGQPTDFLGTFGHYATQVLPPETRLGLSTIGEVARAKRSAELLPELGPWVHEAVLFEILNRLVVETRFEDVVSAVAQHFGIRASDVARTLGFLLKEGIIRAHVE